MNTLTAKPNIPNGPNLLRIEVIAPLCGFKYRPYLVVFDFQEGCHS